jgi:hypothetical protein
MKIVIIDDDRFYCYGLYCLIDKIVQATSGDKPDFFWSWQDIDNKTDFIFLSDSPVLRFFYYKFIKNAGSKSPVVFITQDDVSNEKYASNGKNELKLWRGASISYLEEYIESIVTRKTELINEHVCYEHTESSVKLTSNEWELVRILSAGVKLGEAAAMMGVPYSTLCNYKYRIMQKKSLRSKSEFNDFLVTTRRIGTWIGEE